MAYQYYYCPFTHPDATTLDTMQKYQAKGAGRCVIITPSSYYKDGAFVTYMGRQPALRDVPYNAVLLIDGHGSKISSEGRSNTGLAQHGKAPVIVPTTDPDANDPTALTSFRLGQLIRREKLPENHIAIRMLTCYGAGAAAAYNGLNPVKSMHSSSNQRDYDAGGVFARALAMSLGGTGYKNIVVGGYRGPVVNSTTSGRTTVRLDDLSDSGTRVDAASDKERYMAWFDSRGKDVGKPPWLRSQKRPDLV